MSSVPLQEKSETVNQSIMDTAIKYACQTFFEMGDIYETRTELAVSGISAHLSSSEQAVVEGFPVSAMEPRYFMFPVPVATRSKA
jgi:hypothetical protein